jgi:hypothetical protein
VCVGAAKLGSSKPEVQSVGELVENVETGRRVFDLDGVEVEVGCRSSDSVPRAAAHASLHTPERMQPGPFSTISPCIAFSPGRLAGGRLFSPRLVGGPPSQAMGWELTLSTATHRFVWW